MQIEEKYIEQARELIRLIGGEHQQVLSTKGGAEGATSLSPGAGTTDSGSVGLELEGDTITVSHQPVPYKMDLPDELNSRRYRLRDADQQKIYFNVCTFDGQPVEVFAKGSELVSGSYWNTICRLLSLCMRYNIPLDDIKKQLRKSSDSVSDMPSRLARILDKYDEPIVAERIDPADCWGPIQPRAMSLEDKPTRPDWVEPSVPDEWQEVNLSGRHSTGCPECSGSLTPGGGCMTCLSCGWSKCS